MRFETLSLAITTFSEQDKDLLQNTGAVLKIVDCDMNEGILHEVVIGTILNFHTNPDFMKVFSYEKIHNYEYALFEKIPGISLRSFVLRIIKGDFVDLHKENHIEHATLESALSELKLILIQVVFTLCDK